MEIRALRRNSLSQRIADRLRTEIAEEYSPGDKLPTEARLAERFGVSNHTVREGLSVLAQEGWVHRRQGSGTYAARPEPHQTGAECGREPRAERKRVALRIERDLTDPHLSYFYLRVLYCLQQDLADRGWEPRPYFGRITTETLADRPEPCPELIQDAEAGRLSGIVAVGTLPDANWIDPLRRVGVPLVGTVPIYDYSVGTQREARLEGGVSALVEAGCRRLAMLGWDDPYRPAMVSHQALFEAALRRRGLPVNRAWIRQDLHPNACGAGWEQFRDIWTTSHTKPDGLLICDDMLYPEAAAAILELGIRVPRQLHVVSYANKGSGMFCPFPTTLLEIDPAATATALVEQIEGLIIDGTVDEPHVCLPHRVLHIERPAALTFANTDWPARES